MYKYNSKFFTAKLIFRNFNSKFTMTKFFNSKFTMTKFLTVNLL